MIRIFCKEPCGVWLTQRRKVCPLCPSWGEIFELLMGPKSWVELRNSSPARPGPARAAGEVVEKHLIRLNSWELKNLAAIDCRQF